jgi:hypothetical protein
MAAFGVGSNASPRAYPSQVPLCAVNGALGSYRQEGMVGIDVDAGVGVPVVHIGGLQNVSIIGVNGANPTGSGGLPTGCLKGTQGRIAKLMVTAAGTAATFIYDNNAGNSTGNIIAIIPASPTVGAFYTVDMPANAGISIPAQVNASTFTLGYS